MDIEITWHNTRYISYMDIYILIDVIGGTLCLSEVMQVLSFLFSFFFSMPPASGVSWLTDKGSSMILRGKTEIRPYVRTPRIYLVFWHSGADLIN